MDNRLPRTDITLPSGPGTARARLEAIEDAVLSPYAAHSRQSAGRETPEAESDLRTGYQRDRDRIVHANAFRRLRGKTQVFIAPAGDHFVTRLSHALEVAQVARDLARALALNEDLVEAIALAHDLGHAPFGHAGQDALDELLRGGYRHDEQSVRVVRFLENGGQGLNLSAEVIDGIRTHRKPRATLGQEPDDPPSTLEARVVRLADAVAYVNHDLEDAQRARIITESDLPGDAVRALGRDRAERIDTVLADVFATCAGQPRVSMSQPVLAAMDELREFLFQQVYTNPAVKREAARSRHVVRELFHYFRESPESMPAEYQYDPREEGVDRRVADYIAGMTDSFAIHLFQELFVPKMWPA